MGGGEASDLDVGSAVENRKERESMSDRYDVEQSLMSCWAVIDDIKLLSEAVLDGKMNTDEVANYLIGLHSVYGLKFQNCFDQFSELQKGKK